MKYNYILLKRFGTIKFISNKDLQTSVRRKQQSLNIYLRIKLTPFNHYDCNKNMF